MDRIKQNTCSVTKNSEYGYVSVKFNTDLINKKSRYMYKVTDTSIIITLATSLDDNTISLKGALSLPTNDHDIPTGRYDLSKESNEDTIIVDYINNGENESE